MVTCKRGQQRNTSKMSVLIQNTVPPPPLPEWARWLYPLRCCIALLCCATAVRVSLRLPMQAACAMSAVPDHSMRVSNRPRSRCGHQMETLSLIVRSPHVIERLVRHEVHPSRNQESQVRRLGAQLHNICSHLASNERRRGQCSPRDPNVRGFLCIVEHRFFPGGIVRQPVEHNPCVGVWKER